jgi:hypothetical protein
VADFVGTRTFTYDATGPRLYEDFSAGSIYHATSVKRLRTRYQDNVIVMEGGFPAVYTFPRFSDIGFGTTTTPTADYSATYDYDGDTDRMSKVTGPGLPTGGANYR